MPYDAENVKLYICDVDKILWHIIFLDVSKFLPEMHLCHDIFKQ